MSAGLVFEHQGLLEGFVPAEEERGFGAVDAGGFVGDASGVFGGEAEETDGGLVDGEDFEVMWAGFDGCVEVTGGIGRGGVGAGGGDGGDEGVVVADLDGAAVGLDEVLDLQARWRRRRGRPSSLLLRSRG